MDASYPIPTLAGAISGYVDVDVEIARFAGGGTLRRVLLRRTNFAAAGAVSASLRNATGGGGEGASITIGSGVEQAESSDVVAIATGGSLYLRVSAADLVSENLSGYAVVDVPGEQEVVVYPIPTLPGLAEARVDDVVSVATLRFAATVNRVALRRSDGAGALTATIECPESGDSIGVSMLPGEDFKPADGAISVPQDGSLTLTITAADVGSTNLGGYVELSPVFAYLATLAQCKRYLSIGDSSKDAILLDLLAGTSDLMEEWMRRRIIPTSYLSEFHELSGDVDVVSVDHWPIVTIEAVRVNGVLLSTSEYRRVHERSIQRLDSSGRPIDFDSGDVEVDYTAGYSSVPTGLRNACVAEVALRYKNSTPGGGRLGTRGEALPQGVETSYDEHRFLASTLEAMNTYRRRW